jgi:outer membrane protein OmpA-like peptidoglycan-associated protein
MELSQKRAGVVSQYLQSHGVNGQRLYVEGYGPHYPIADNSTTQGRAENRRVEITLKPLTHS